MPRLRVLVLFDLPCAPMLGARPEEVMVGPDWQDERDVVRALKRADHDVSLVGVYNDLANTIAEIQAKKPDVVFNQCESFAGNRLQEPHIASMLELLRLPYTGAGPDALTICKDKGLSKSILSPHGVRVPAFAVSSRARPLKHFDASMVFPAIVKPLDLDSSEGIAQASLVTNAAEALKRISWLHQRLDTDAIVEEYIEGRELYLGVMGNDRLTVFPPTELTFKRLPKAAPRMLTYKAKWDLNYRRKYGIDSDKVRSLPQPVLDQLMESSKIVYRLCKIAGYARLDYRLPEDGSPPVFLEANPNPSIKRQDDFALAARCAGVTYEALIERIVRLAVAANERRHGPRPDLQSA